MISGFQVSSGGVTVSVSVSGKSIEIFTSAKVLTLQGGEAENFLDCLKVIASIHVLQSADNKHCQY